MELLIPQLLMLGHGDQDGEVGGEVYGVLHLVVFPEEDFSIVIGNI
jgi:hypothetical protein